jgi:hypothetical protein
MSKIKERKTPGKANTEILSAALGRNSIQQPIAAPMLKNAADMSIVVRWNFILTNG